MKLKITSTWKFSNWYFVSDVKLLGFGWHYMDTQFSVWLFLIDFCIDLTIFDKKQDLPEPF